MKGGDVGHKGFSSHGGDEQMAENRKGASGVKKTPCVAAAVSLEQHPPRVIEADISFQIDETSRRRLSAPVGFAREG